MNIYEQRRADFKALGEHLDALASPGQMAIRQAEYDRIFYKWPETVTHLKAPTPTHLPAWNRRFNDPHGEAVYARSRCGYSNKFLTLAFSDTPTCEFCKAEALWTPTP